MCGEAYIEVAVSKGARVGAMTLCIISKCVGRLRLVHDLGCADGRTNQRNGSLESSQHLGHHQIVSTGSYYGSHDALHGRGEYTRAGRVR